MSRMAKEAVVPQDRGEARILLDGKEVGDHARVESHEVEDGDPLTGCGWSVALGLVAISLFHWVFEYRP